MAALRYAVIGLGVMGRNHARVIRELDGVTLAAVVDPFASEGDIPGVPVHAEVDAVLGSGIDAAIVAVPTTAHEEVALQLAEAGVHVLVEKPIAADVEQGARMAEAFRSRGLVGAVGHIERFNPALQNLRKRLDAGELGDVYQIATRRQGPFPARIADVGVIKDLATHDIDLTSWLAQSPFRTVHANTSRRSGRPHEDLVAFNGRLDDGIITNHLVNWMSPMKERITVVTGESGAFVADTLSGDLTFYENGTDATEWDAVSAFRGVAEGSVIRYALKKREPLRIEHEAFRDAILHGRPGIVTMDEGLATLAVAEAVMQSAAQEREVVVDRVAGPAESAR
ncbi:Gfo/Idh/MocA family oxidoreductase [Leifsonia shinshuensis]|uniref:Gfo/Idh/MocA family oxidoreductase n=1 Tax=Leifsonia shinshuensis TaxID=150026 RepID=UPI002857F86B|nr:Gfo/Idh/MocA family oxidoreductase [Leifsonia shinshuensis]MDR6973262.1 putative dehydrogenase [Leifsonia shinshuensis]